MIEPQQLAVHPTRPSSVIPMVVGLVIFTCWITWRAKSIERMPDRTSRPLALLNRTAPDFTLPALGGRTVSLADYRTQNKNVVISFWASWCGPCRLELPALKAFYEKTHKPDADFEFLAISLDEEPQAAVTATTQMKLPFPVLLDPHQKAAGAYMVSGIPTLFVVNKSGRVTYGQSGFDMALEAALTRQLVIDPKLVSPEGPNAASRH